MTAGGPVVYERRAEGGGAEGGGEAARVVFVHGSMDRGASFLKVTRRLPDVDTVRYDRAGYGRSAHLAPVPTFDAAVAELLHVVGEQPSVVVGHSFGGVLALAASVRRPGVVRSVVAYESPMPWAEWWPTRSAGGEAVAAAGEQGPEEAAEGFMRRMIGDERWERLPPSTRESRRAEGAALVNEMRFVRIDEPPFDLGAIDVPVLAAHGTASADRHQRSAQEVARTVRDGELAVIDGADHGAHFTHAEEFAALVRRALDRYSARHV